MRLAAIGVVLGVWLLGAATLAAQPLSDAATSAADLDARVPAPAVESSAPAFHLALGTLPLTIGWTSYPGPSERPSHDQLLDSRRPATVIDHWGQSQRFALTYPGIPPSRSAPQPRGARRLNRTLVPIPLLCWRRPAVLVGGRGSIALSPSIVVGRRLTFMPDVFPGGRTFGVAVEVKIRLNETTVARPAPPPTAILSRARALLDQTRQ